MINLYCILFVLAFLASALITSGTLFLLSLTLLFVYFLCIIVDLKKLKAKLKASDYSNLDSVLNFDETYTTLIGNINYYLIKSRNILIKNIENSDPKDSELEEDTKKFRYQEKISAIIGNDITNFLEALSRFSKETASSDAVVISVIKGNEIIEDNFLINEIDSFKDLYRDFTEEILRENFDLLGYKKMSECGFLGDRFEKFGFKAFSCTLAKSKEKNILIWNGYRKKTANSNSLKNIQILNKALQSELISQKRVIELTEKVKSSMHEKLAKTNFMAHISHDIRSPLHNVKSILSLLKDEHLRSKVTDESTLDLINAGKDNCETAEELVETLLDFSNLSQGDLKAKKTVFNLASVVKSVVANYRYTAKEKGLDLQVLAPEILAIEADKSHLKRIIQNLVSNAIKYTKRGDVQVILSPATDKKIGLKIMDTGVGMKSDEVAKLFTPFNRFNKDMADGIGLGLVLTKALVEVNGGRIKVSSIKNSGTTFTVVLPATAKEVSFTELELDEKNLNYNSSLTIPNSHALKKTNKNKSKKILILDDDIDYLKTISKSIELFDYEVMQCFSVEQAMSIYNYEQPDYIISDIEVPGGGGEKFIDFINNNYNPKPIIILSGKDDSELKEKLLSKGAKKVLLKPVEVKELLGYFENEESLEMAI